ncbi:MAG: hypothetical protein A2076_00865 [Geobacteraceae bacterium GWC2_53_11]|nr:MAG: hypothetical protein A2076_00865 [Geobacteraceae bacterium GWC2_53_11]
MYVAFVDLLGFSSAVESLSEADDVSFADLVSETTSLGSKTPYSYHLSSSSVRNLYDMYTEFQRECEKAAWVLSEYHSHVRFSQKMSAPDAQGDNFSYKAVVFSDSIFLAASSLEPVIDAAGELIANLLLKKIPSRGSIAKGSFRTFEWNLKTGQGASFTACAPFLGSGVIRAYHTESKGPRGIRLLINKSCWQDVQALDSWALLSLSPDEMSEHWGHEVNLDLYGLSGNANITLLQMMAEELSNLVPDNIKARHYDPTLSAYSRMAAVDRDQPRQFTRSDWRDEF